jgi:hypothetical protein
MLTTLIASWQRLHGHRFRVKRSDHRAQQTPIHIKTRGGYRVGLETNPPILLENFVNSLLLDAKTFDCLRRVTGIGEQGTAALLYTLRSIVTSLSHIPELATINRAYLNFLLCLERSALDLGLARNHWHRYLYLTLSNTEALAETWQHTQLERAAGGQLTVGLENQMRPTAVLERILRDEAALRLLKARLGLTTRELNATFKGLFSLLPGNTPATGTSPQLLVDPWLCRQQWKRSRHDFSQKVKWALDQSASVLPDDPTPDTSNRAQQTWNSKASAEFILDTAVTCVITDLEALDALLPELQSAPRIERMLNILTFHFFRHPRLLIQLHDSPAHMRLPGTAWKERAALWAARRKRPYWCF